MATRMTRRGQGEDETASDQWTEATASEDGEAEMEGDRREQPEPEESGPPGGLQDFGRALQEQIAQALQPAVAEFRQQMAEAVREEMDEAPEPDQSSRRREARRAPEPGPDDGQQTGRPASQQPVQRADDDSADDDSMEQPEQPRAQGSADHPDESSRRQEASPAQDSDEGQQPPEGARGERAQPPRDRRGETRQLAPAARPPARRRVRPGEVFDARGAVRVARLRMARDWRDSGSTYRAIHAFMEIPARYPDGGAANAATEELLDMAMALAQQGKFYAALNIFDKLEELL